MSTAGTPLQNSIYSQERLVERALPEMLSPAGYMLTGTMSPSLDKTPVTSASGRPTTLIRAVSW